VELIPLVDLKALNQSLIKTTNKSKMGSSVRSKVNLNKHKKLNMVGWYVEPCIPTQEEILLYIENNKRI